MKYNTTADRDDECQCCGYPFDRHDRCIDVAGDGAGPLACSSKCAEEIIRVELDYQFGSNQWLHNPAN